MQIHIEDRRLRPILEKVEARRPPGFRGRPGALPHLRHSGRRLHGQPGPRAHARQRDLVQREPPHQSHRRVRGELQAVRVRQARQGSQSVHLVARGSLASGGRGLERSRHRIPHRGRPASRTDAGLVLRDAARPEAAFPGSPPEGLHDGGDGVSGAAREAFHSGDAHAADGRGRGFACPAAAPKSSTNACAASSAITKSTARSGSR